MLFRMSVFCFKIFISCSDIGFTFFSSGCECFYLIKYVSCSDTFLCPPVGGSYQLTHVSCFYNLFCFLFTFQDVSVESWSHMFQVLIFVLHSVLFRRWMLQVNHLCSMFWHLFFFFVLQDVSTLSSQLFLCFNICLFSVYLVSKCSWLILAFHALILDHVCFLASEFFYLITQF